jgi:hypothetical protein
MIKNKNEYDPEKKTKEKLKDLNSIVTEVDNLMSISTDPFVTRVNTVSSISDSKQATLLSKQTGVFLGSNIRCKENAPWIEDEEEDDKMIWSNNGGIKDSIDHGMNNN